MTAPSAPQYDRLPPVGRAPKPVSLATLSVDLQAVALFGASLLARRSFLPFGWVDGALQVVVPPRFPKAVADEVAFAAGCPVTLVEAADGNLPKLIQRAVAALARGETRLPAEAADTSGFTSELVYLEDLSELGASASSSAGLSLGLGLMELTPPAAGRPESPLPQVLTLDAPAAPAPAPTPSLPPVVDLEPTERRAAAPPSASPQGAASASAGSGHPARPVHGEEELIEDPDALDLDLDLLSEPEEDSGTSSSKARALVLGGRTPEGRRLVEALRSFGLRVSEASLEEWESLRASVGDPAVLVLTLADAGGDPLAALRRLRKETNPNESRLVAILLVPAELEGWRAEADLAATYGADIVLGPTWEAPLLRRRLLAALRARTKRELPLKPGPRDAQAIELSRGAAERYLEGHVDEAIAQFGEALECDPGLASAQVGLAMAWVKQQRPVEAILAFERALAVDPQLTSALRHLAMLYEKRGFRWKALDTWERALTAKPDEEQRQEILARIQSLKGKEP